MVVVVIIGILVAIAVPIYNTIQSSARDNAHDANIRTIEGMIELYKADNNGNVPADEDALQPGYILEWPTSPGSYEVENGVLTADPAKDSGPPYSW
jgi:type II secretory pathway pseudopilin PulG